MNELRGSLLAPLALLLALGASTGEAPKAGTPEALAKAVLEALKKEDFKAATKDFDAAMKKALPADELGKGWKALLAKVGPLRKEGPVRKVKLEGYDVVLTTCEFEKAKFDMRVSVKDGKIGGLGFQEPATKYAFKPPAYARPEMYVEKELTLGAGGDWPLPATLTLPKGAFPAVVLVHGSGPHDRDETIVASKPFRDLAWGLATQGVAVLRYVKRTKQHGLRMVRGKPFTIKEETVDDAIAAVALLRKQKEIDAKRVFVVGHSLGAFAAPRIATEAPDVAGLVLLAGNSRPLEDLVAEQFTYLLGLQGDSEEIKKELAKIKAQVARVRDAKLSADTPDLPLGLSGTYWLALKAYSPTATAARLKKPMLILQGERDHQITMEDFAGWKKALAGRKDVTFKSYPKLFHLFMVGTGKGKSKPEEYVVPGHVDKEVIDDIAAWIKKR